MSQQPDRGQIRPVEMGKSLLTNGTMRSTLKILVLCAMLAIAGVATMGPAAASHGHSGDDVDVDVEINVDGCSDPDADRWWYGSWGYRDSDDACDGWR